MLAVARGFVSTRAVTAAALLGALAAPAGAQSLSLTYRLDPVNAPQSPKASPLVNRCTGLTWAASLAAACIAEATAARVVTAVNALRAEMHPPEDAREAAPRVRRVEAQGAYAATEAAPRSADLPVLGSPAEARVLRAAGGRDDYIGSARGVDVNFRFGSKYRVRSGDEGWDVYKFSDVTSENRLQSTKNLGVELLFPFQ